MTDEEDTKFKTFQEIMKVQEDLRGTFNVNIDGVSIANKMEGLELDYKILSSLIHFDIIGVQPMSSNKGDAYYLDWDDNNSKNLVIKCEDMKAKTREIKAGFTMEMGDGNMHGIDLKEEICIAVAMEFVQEKNDELLAAIKKECHTSKYKFKDTSKGTTRMEIMILLAKIRNSVAKKSRRGLGSFFIVPSKVLAVIHSFVTTTGDFEYVPFYSPNPTFGTSVHLAGWIRMGEPGKDVLIPVYHDPMSEKDNWIITGYKGDTMVDVGAIYAPYHLVNFTYKMKETPTEVDRMGTLPIVEEVFVGRTRDDFFGPRKDFFHVVELDMTEIDKFFAELKTEAA
jgi:hypothetical protein